jgi:hypothetical protein
MLQISPGVYVNIIDESEYVNAASVTTVFMPFFSDKGIDNKLAYINGRKTLRSEFTVNDLTVQGKNFREGWIDLDRWLSISGGSYGIRLLPDDATFATLMLGITTLDNGKQVFSLMSIPDMNSEKEIETLIGGSTLTSTKPIMVFYGMGRGEWYNDIGINLTPVINEEDTYSLDLYLKDKQGDMYIDRTYKVAFKENMLSLEGDSLFIEDVLKANDTRLKCLVNLNNIDNFKDFATVDPVKAIVSEPPVDPLDGDRYIAAPNATGAFVGYDNMIMSFNAGENLWEVADTPVRGYVVLVEEANERYLFDGDDWSVFNMFYSMFSAESPNDLDYKMLGNGSSGSLYGENNMIVPSVAEDLLIKAYSGLIDTKLLDTEYVYFPYVLCPYASTYIADAAVALSKLYRKDCIAFITLPDSSSPDDDIETKQKYYNFNTWYAAIYGNWSRVRQIDLGREIWVSPIYHMAQAMPYTLTVATLGDAPAGFDHAMCNEAKELRYYPLRGDMDNLYIDRVNYLAMFRNGTCIYQQLTSQMKDSSLSDINIVNVVLFITRTVKTFCNNFIYKKNTPTTHARISKSLNEFLKSQQDAGNIDKFTVDVGADEYEYKMKKCHVNIILWPTKVIEKIEINEYIR